MLRPAIDDDIPVIVALMNRAYRGPAHTGGWHTEAGLIAGTRTTADLLRAEIAAAPDASMLLWSMPDGDGDGADDGAPGCVWLQPLGDGVWYLGSLTVDPARQGAGLGDTLLAAAEAWVAARGATRVRISVVNVRDALIAWYERRGYRRTGETAPFPYGDDRFGTPLRDDLAFAVLEKSLR